MKYRNGKVEKKRIRIIKFILSGIFIGLVTLGCSVKEEIPGESFQDAVNWISRKPNEFSPGEKWVYNQTGYMLTKWIIELKSGKSWEEFAADRIFVPSGMSSTTFGDLRDIIRGRASIYERHPKGGKYVLNL